MRYYDQMIFEMSKEGRIGYHLKKKNFQDIKLPQSLLRQEKADLPEVSEFDVVRHYT
ncbi:MAG: aminomethyl-transferring glycine dehydrogenase subunit GcvPB, partial [Acholeplasmataceae bacterium]|nr:aminomethyl-transferring glycine dehydrogenase subunit GcvPB [Acholeplasmataceae bacterium]